MNILSSIIKAIPMIALITSCNGQIKNEKMVEVKIDGNCEMCKKTIENAGSINRISKTNWNKDTKTAILHFDSSKMNMDEALKKVALAGYDNEKFLAPDDAYAKLPDCCKYERTRKKTDKIHTLIDSSMNHQTTQTADANQLKSVMNAYFELKNALISTDQKTAHAKAIELKTVLSKVDMNQLKKEQQTVWKDVNKDLITASENISNANSIEKQRQYFIALSDNMYQLAKTAQLGTTVYYQHCPMYNDGKGANWLSTENAVKNPYYGSQMLNCGKTTETIK